MNTTYERRLAGKFREAQNYLKIKEFSKSNKYLLEDIENTLKK